MARRPNNDEIVELIPPKWLSKPARVWFKRWAKDLADRGTTVITDAAALCEMATVAAELDQLRASLTANGHVYETFTESGHKMVRARPEAALAADASRRLAGLLQQFKLTPKSREAGRG
jgi:P27 family predicted phage terminase small subunit